MQQHKDQEVLQVFQDIIEKAWDNPSYKQELIARPTETIESFMGAKLNLPSGVKIVVRDQSDESYAYLNIPQKLSQEELMEMELSDEQLETVAGGEGPFIVTYIVGTIGIALGAYALGQLHHKSDC